MNKPLIGKIRATIALLAIAGLCAAGYGQTASKAGEPANSEPQKLDKFVVTGSFIPTPTMEPIAPVAIFSELEIRTTGAVTPVEALRFLPSFIGNPGATEFDSNGASGATGINLRGLGAGQTLTLLDGRPAGNFANLSLLPIEAIDRVEVMRDGAGIIYGSAAIGGAVNVILKKNYSGLTTDFYGGAATRTPGDRATFQGSFVAGNGNGKTSIVVTGSYFKNRTIYARDRPNSATADKRALGGVNGGSPTFATVIGNNGGGNPLILKSGISTPTSIADYITMDTVTFSSNQLFNFRQYSPSAPGQKRNSFYTSMEHKAFNDAVVIFGNFTYAKLTTLNGLAPAPFALDSEPVSGGPAVGSLSTFGPYNRYVVQPSIGTSVGTGGILNDENGDIIRYRSVELGNRANEQIYNDFRYQVGLKGNLGKDWKWEASMIVENENYYQADSGVPNLKALDAQVIAGNFNVFAPANSTGSATINGKTYNWDNAKALRAAAIVAQQVTDTNIHAQDARVGGTITELPAGPLGMAVGYERRSGNSSFKPEGTYASGSVLGLNSFVGDYSEFKRQALFGEIKVPLISSKNKLPFAHDLSVGALARNEEQTIFGTNAVTKQWDNAKYKKTNPSVNVQYSPTEEYKIRSTWSKGFRAPGSGTVFAAIGTSNPTIQDPLGFPTTAQTTIVIRGNRDLQPESSKAWSFGVVGAPKSIIKGFNFTVDYYNIEVSGIIANNANAVLAANAAGQGSGFKAGDPTTINPNAPFAKYINRSANGRLNNSGSFLANFGTTSRGAVFSDYLNIASRKVSGMEYTVTYSLPTTDMGRFTFMLAANQFLKFDQTNAPGLKPTSYLGKFVSTVGDPISPGSIPKWKGNLVTRWNWKGFDVNATVNYIQKYLDDPLFCISPKMQAFYNAGTPKTDPAFAAFLAAPEGADPKLGGRHWVDAFVTLDLQAGYRFTSTVTYLDGVKVSVGARNVLDKLAPYAFGAFNDSYDTRTHNNIGRFVYMSLRKDF